MYVLILNLGLKSIRSIVFNKEGEVISKYWLPVKTVIGGPLVEQDANEWWEQSKRVIKATLTPEVQENLSHISVTSSSCCLVMLDSQDNPLANVIMVSDKRSQRQAQRLKNDFSFLFTNQNHLPEPSYMFPKMMWMKENKPEVFAGVKKFMASDDFLIYRLCGSFVTDYLNAEKLYYDIPSQTYPQRLLAYLGITKDALPSVVDVGAVAGSLKGELKEEFGLHQDVKVVVSTYDAVCAFWGAGVAEEGEVSHVCGTCSSFRVYSNVRTAPGNGILAQQFKNPDMYVVGGSNNIEGGVIEWAKDCFYGDSYPIHNELIYEIMENEAKESVVGARGLLFLPYLLGERVPVWDPHVRGMFFGLERIHTRKDMMRSIFESTGFNTLNMLRTIEAKGVKVNSIRMSGGLSRIDYICKLKADITGKEVAVLKEYETTALGAFMIASVAAGIFPDLKAAASVVKVKKVIKPDMEAHERYKQLYNLFIGLYRQTTGVFRQRTDMLASINDKGLTVTNL